MAKANVKGRGNQKIGPHAYYRHLKGYTKALERGDLIAANRHQDKMEAARKVDA